MKEIQEPVLLTLFGELELTNALELRVFRRELSAAQRDAVRLAFRENIAPGVYLLKPVPTAVFETAQRIARQNRQTRRAYSRYLTCRLGTRL